MTSLWLLTVEELVLYAVIVVVAFRVISAHTRPDAGGAPKALILFIAGLVFLLAMFLPGINKHTNDAATKARLAKYCDGAGEKVFATIPDVTGVMAYRRHNESGSEGLYHEDDGNGSAYTRLPWRRYKFFEATSVQPDHAGSIDQFTAGTSTRRDEPAARIAFSWNRLTSIEDQSEKLYGDETVVYDRVDHKVLARRTIYFHVDPGRNIYETKVALCPGMNLGEDPAYIDHRPRDSYGFVSRVAIPPKLDTVAVASNFDLFPGSGRKTKSSCSLGLKISDGLRREDIEILRQKDDLVLQLKSGSDAIICQHWFGAGRPAPAPGGSQVVRFADGTVIYDHQIDRVVR